MIQGLVSSQGMDNVQSTTDTSPDTDVCGTGSDVPHIEAGGGIYNVRVESSSDNFFLS